MKEEKRLELTLETHELTIVRRCRRPPPEFCPVCRTHAPHFSVGESGSILARSEAAVFRLVESGKIHSRETAAGRLRLCGNSLAEFGKNNKE